MTRRERKRQARKRGKQEPVEPADAPESRNPTLGEMVVASRKNQLSARQWLGR